MAAIHKKNVETKDVRASWLVKFAENFLRWHQNARKKNSGGLRASDLPLIDSVGDCGSRRKHEKRGGEVERDKRNLRERDR